jgi:hypothetical protein
VRLLRQKGFEACNVSGGYLTYRHVKGSQAL